MKPARPVSLFELPPAKRAELEATIDRHPSMCVDAAAVPAAPAQTRRGRMGERWRCHHCGRAFGQWAAAERHRHRNDYGGFVGRIELVLR